MKSTALGTAVLAAAWLGLGLAFLAGAWGAALGAFGVLAVLAGTRRPLAPARAAVQRQAPGSVSQGEFLQTTVQVRGPAAGALDVEVPVPLGATLLRETRHTQPGACTVTQDLQAVAVGALDWPDVTIHATDPLGLWSDQRRQGAPAPCTVRPDAKWALLGRRLGMRNPVQSTVKALLSSERGLEIERLRPYQAGDRVRDIDWKATARVQDLQVRDRERHIPRPATVVLDCGASMRVQRHDAKLVSAVRVARGVLGAASGAGTMAHLVGVHADGCQTRTITGLLDAEAALLRLLAACPPVNAGLPPQDPVGPSQIVAAVGQVPGLQVAILDAEAHPDWALEVLPLLKARGPVIAIVPATGAHLYRRGEARGPVLAQLRRWRRNRDAFHDAARRLGVPFHVLRPGDEDAILDAVARRLA